jgi:hypothetical protein
MKIQLRMYSYMGHTLFLRLWCVILAVHVLTSEKMRDFHAVLQNQKRSSTEAGFWLSELRSRHLSL